MSDSALTPLALEAAAEAGRTRLLMRNGAVDPSGVPGDG